MANDPDVVIKALSRDGNGEVHLMDGAQSVFTLKEVTFATQVARSMKDAMGPGELYFIGERGRQEVDGNGVCPECQVNRLGMRK